MLISRNFVNFRSLILRPFTRFALKSKPRALWFRPQYHGRHAFSSEATCRTSGAPTTKRLSLYNTFKRTTEEVRVGPHKVHVNVGCSSSRCSSGHRQVGTVYCCGPTVYDESHLGHAFTYVRFDLFRRVLATYCDLDLIVAMNITDIDDKIILKANSESPTSQDANRFADVGQRYFNSFAADLASLNVSQPHFYLRVTDHIDDIIMYIQRLEQNGFAYINEETGDVVFESSRVEPFGETHEVESDKSRGKKSPRDFVLWKLSKPGEPNWEYKSVASGKAIVGRPGWHVECSACANGVFGPLIDFHFGGKDLLFPHHYNESACCQAHHNGPSDSEPVYEWSRHWLHSGHLLFDKEKMSKSLGNIVSIKSFLENDTANVLRIFCIRGHYRSDFHYDARMLEQARAYDSKLKHFVHFITTELKSLSASQFISETNQTNKHHLGYASDLLEKAEQDIMNGIADDLDLDAGLQAVLRLFKYYHEENGKFCLLDLARTKFFLERWFTSMGLQYNLPVALSVQASQSLRETAAIEILSEVREDIRTLALKRLAFEKKRSKGVEFAAGEDAGDKMAHLLLNISDDLRDKLKSNGFVFEDAPVAKKKL